MNSNIEKFILFTIIAIILLFTEIIKLASTSEGRKTLKSAKLNLMQTSNVAEKKSETPDKPAVNKSEAKKVKSVKATTKNEATKRPLTPHSEIFKKNPGESFFFGRFEQDANFKNGPETIEWIVLENIEQNKIIAISKMALVKEQFSWRYCKIKDFEDLDTWKFDALRRNVFNDFTNRASFSKNEIALMNNVSFGNLMLDQDNSSQEKKWVKENLTIKEINKYLDLYATDFENNEFKKSILEFNCLRKSLISKFKNVKIPEELTYKDSYPVYVYKGNDTKIFFGTGISLLNINEAIKYADILFSETFDIRTEYAKKYKGFLDKYQPDEFTENYSEKNGYILSWLNSDGINEYFAAVMLNRFNTKSKKYCGLSKIFEMKDSNDKDRSKCLEFNFGGISQIGRIKDSDYVYIRPVLRISK